MASLPRLERPLDFLVVADHAKNLGLAPGNRRSSNPSWLKNEWGKMEHDLVKSRDSKAGSRRTTTGCTKPGRSTIRSRK